MEAKHAMSARDQSIEAERFQAMLDSDSFCLLMVRVGAELQRAQRTCERGDTGLEVRRAQGAASALRTVQGLPKLILGELKGGKRAGGETVE